MAEVERHAGNLKLIGGHVSLDFINTVDWHCSEHPHEWLRSYGDLVAWSEHASLVTHDEAEHLQSFAAERQALAAAVVEHAITLREALYRTFRATLAQHAPDEAALAVLNTAHAELVRRRRLVVDHVRLTWAWADADTALDHMLWPVIHTAVELLTSEEVQLVRMCADERCGWLFLDTSRNHRRRWCAMEDCGNRAKARRHYHRSQGV
jgi:predicted RNA-binding Zn ribbon-like protein